MPLYPPPPLGISTIVFHANASGMCPSRNAKFFMLISLFQCSLSGYFSLVATLIHAFNCSTAITGGPPARPVRSLRAATVISSPFGGLSAILTGCTSIGIVSPSGRRRLYRSSLRVKCVPFTLWWRVLGVPWPLGTTSVSFSTLPSSGHILLVYQSPPPLYSPCVSFQPSVTRETS